MAETQKQGRYTLAESDFVVVKDGDGIEVGVAPKHWGADQLPAGHRKTGRAPSRSTATQTVVNEAVEQARAQSDARIAELEARLEAAGVSSAPSVPAVSATRADLEAYAVAHAGITEAAAKEYANREDLHAAILASQST